MVDLSRPPLRGCDQPSTFTGWLPTSKRAQTRAQATVSDCVGAHTHTHTQPPLPLVVNSKHQDCPTVNILFCSVLFSTEQNRNHVHRLLTSVAKEQFPVGERVCVMSLRDTERRRPPTTALPFSHARLPYKFNAREMASRAGPTTEW